MQVDGYERKTRAAVETFLRERCQAISAELVCLGGSKKVVNWQSLQLILEDLEEEGKVRVTQIGSKTKLYEWVGGA